MKIVLVASTFPASDTDAAPAFVKDLAIALKKDDPTLHIDVLAPAWIDETQPFTRRAFFEEHRFRYFWPARAQRLAGRGIVPAIEAERTLLVQVPFLFFFEALALWRHVRRHRPDVIYAHWFTPQGVVAAVVARLTGVPWVLTSHANDVRVWRRLPVLGPALVRALLPTAARITAVSAATEAKMRAFFTDEEWARLAPRVARIPMGVDLRALAPSADDPHTLKERHQLAHKRVVYFIGRLAEKKGVSFLLEAFAALSAPAHADVVLVIAGDGPLRTALEGEAARLGLGDRVRFIGFVTGDRKLELLQLADVVAVPSIETASGDSEGFPVVIMEALAAGKVCVASDATGAEGVLEDGVSGFVVPQKDAHALSVALTRALALTSVERTTLGGQARAAAQALDWAAIAARHRAWLLNDVAR